MRHRTVMLIVAGLLIIAALSFEARRLWRRCGDEEIAGLLAKVLPRDTDGDGIVISNARLLAGQFFAFPYQCEADTTPLRGNVDLSKQSWQHIQYTVSHIDGMQHVSLVQAASAAGQ